MIVIQVEKPIAIPQPSKLVGENLPCKGIIECRQKDNWPRFLWGETDSKMWSRIYNSRYNIWGESELSVQMRENADDEWLTFSSNSPTCALLTWSSASRPGNHGSNRCMDISTSSQRETRSAGSVSCREATPTNKSMSQTEAYTEDNFCCTISSFEISSHVLAGFRPSPLRTSL